MLETGQAVRRCNDKIDVAVFCKVTDIQDWRGLGKDDLKFYSSKLCRPDKLLHLALGFFASSLLQAGNVIQGRAFGLNRCTRGKWHSAKRSRLLIHSRIRWHTGDLPASNRRNPPGRESSCSQTLFAARPFAELSHNKYGAGRMLHHAFRRAP